MIAQVTLGVVCLLLIGVVLIRERYWRRRFGIMKREASKIAEENRHWTRAAMRHDESVRRSR